MPPLVSVVTSVYNGERYLRQSVDSILNQTFRDFEFIIVNDGSTDKTKEILESYTDQRIILINQENMGLTKSLNKGIALAKGKYIARQDVDDISKPERLEKQIEFMEENPRAGLLSSRFQFIDESGKVVRPCYVYLDNETLQKGLMEINRFCHAGAIVRKKALEEVGVYRDFFKYAQDYDLWLRIAEKYEIYNLPDFLVQYRESEDAISSKKILLQSRYAGVAREMAMTRRTKGVDAIALGAKPNLTQPRHLTLELKNKLSQYYENARTEALKKGKYWLYIKNTVMFRWMNMLKRRTSQKGL